MNTFITKYRETNEISIAKAWAIICVVVGHSGCPEVLRNFIYLFHMPFFFFISGYCFKEKYLSDFKSFFIHRINGLYIPFVKWTLIFILLHNSFYDIYIYNSDYGSGNGLVKYSLGQYPHLIFAALRFNTQEQLLGVFWFLSSLFFGYYVFYILLRFFKKTILCATILLSINMLLVYYSIEVPYIGLRTFYPAFFIMFGYIYKKKIEGSLSKKNTNIYLVICFILLLISSFFIKTEMLRVNEITFVPYCILALLGCISLLYGGKFCMYHMVCGKFWSYIGTHTFEIMTLHFLAFKIVTFVLIKVYNYPIGMLACFPVISYSDYNSWWILYSIVGLLCPLMICYCIEHSILLIKRL